MPSTVISHLFTVAILSISSALLARALPLRHAVPGTIPVPYAPMQFATTSWEKDDKISSGLRIYTRLKNDVFCPRGIRELYADNGGTAEDLLSRFRYGGCINPPAGDESISLDQGIAATSSRTTRNGTTYTESRLFYWTDGRLWNSRSINGAGWRGGNLNFAVEAPGKVISAASFQQTSTGSTHWSVFYTSGSTLFEASQIQLPTGPDEDTWQHTAIGDLGQSCTDCQITSAAWEAVKTGNAGMLGAYLISYKRVYVLNRQTQQGYEWVWDSQSQQWGGTSFPALQHSNSIAFARLDGADINTASKMYSNPTTNPTLIQEISQNGGNWLAEAPVTIASDAQSGTPIEIEVQTANEKMYTHVLYLNAVGQLSYTRFFNNSWSTPHVIEA